MMMHNQNSPYVVNGGSDAPIECRTAYNING